MFAKFIDHKGDKLERVIECDSYEVLHLQDKRIVTTYEGNDGTDWNVGTDWDICYIMNTTGQTFVVIK